MHSNVITLASRLGKPAHRRSAQPTGNNVISLAGWLGRAVPHRTPNGVFFTTLVLASPGEIA